MVNTSSVADGPLSATSGVILDAGGATLAKFEIALVNPVSIPPMSHTSFPVSKVAGSLMPQAGCSTVPCGATVLVGVDWYVGGQSGRALSAPVPVSCAF